MKHKASLLLMEQLVMILVFAICAALCVQVFAGAGALAQELRQRDEAVTLAQNAAEILKATGGDVSRAEQLFEKSGYRPEITAQPSGIPGLAMAQIRVYRDTQLLFSITTGWQEVAP